MALRLSILYRGPLSGCNYDCAYCPFAKRVDDRKKLEDDATALRRFHDWVLGRTADQLKILFTPWGEALTHNAYRQTLISLSRLAHVSRVAIQTNLSCSVEWMEELNRHTASLWCSYHPGQTPREAFLAKCERMSALGVRYSVGAVGIVENLNEVRALQLALPPKVYFWINAYKDAGPQYYSLADAAACREIDPLFDINRENYLSKGEPCAAGESSISLDGDGNIRRCHFIDDVIGNIYADDLEKILHPRHCSRLKCDCHIGYVNLKKLDLDRHFDGWALGRVPTTRHGISGT